MRHVTWVLGIVFLLDRISKYAAQNLPPGKVFSILPGVDFGYFLNPSLLFFPAWSWIPWVALAVLLTILGFWGWNLFRISDFGFRISRPALLPILLGGASNVFDRFVYGGVIDYVEILGLATLNLADILILLGLFALIFNSKRYVQRS